MIKKILQLFTIFSLFLCSARAQDTSAYQLQRAKINALLADRSTNFGKYDESLTARTGIFGLQTKRDLKNSNEILRQIVLNDNAIFNELKVWVDYKDLQMQATKTTANTSDERIRNYRKTIKDLQDQNEAINLKLNKSEKNKDLSFLALIALSLTSIFLIYQLINRKRPAHTN
ncbi:MAG: hypothetical protein V4541_13375 [Bacteroidota bacterium]